MNLVELIKDQLSSSVTKHLSSQIDASEGATRSAVAAAVPALLSALSGLASGGGAGTQKLVSASSRLARGRSRAWSIRCQAIPAPCSSKERAF